MKLKVYDVLITYSGVVLATSEEEAEKLVPDIVSDCGIYGSDVDVSEITNYSSKDDRNYVWMSNSVKTNLPITNRVAGLLAKYDVTVSQLEEASSMEDLHNLLKEAESRQALALETKEKQITLL